MRDKVIVVTGGFGVLGRAVTEAALAAGAYVAIPAREQADKIPARDRLMVLGGVELTDFAATKQALTRLPRVRRPRQCRGRLPLADTRRWRSLRLDRSLPYESFDSSDGNKGGAALSLAAPFLGFGRRVCVRRGWPR
jgi:hypothetical protein